MVSRWAFRQLYDFISHKAAKVGILVVEVDPRHTSTRCPRCGHADFRNRSRQAEFICKHCGLKLHSDLVGALNIAQRARQGLYVSGDAPPDTAWHFVVSAEGQVRASEAASDADLSNNLVSPPCRTL